MRYCALGLLPAAALCYVLGGCTAITDTDPGKIDRDAAMADGAADDGGGSGSDGAAGECPATQIRCGGACVDPSSSTRHCGGCDRPCPGDSRCISGVCDCAEPFGQCGRTCIDLRTSRIHCGECGRSCDRDQLCVDGDCRDFVHAEGCDSCPCRDACDGFDACCPSGEGPLCVEADGCP